MKTSIKERLDNRMAEGTKEAVRLRKLAKIVKIVGEDGQLSLMTIRALGGVTHKENLETVFRDFDFRVRSDNAFPQVIVFTKQLRDSGFLRRFFNPNYITAQSPDSLEVNGVVFRFMSYDDYLSGRHRGMVTNGYFILG